ncbi:MAG: hypothetical protein D6703_00270 [Zetaproteobacteria bacterium]|nr:MAG: hypothetical protein D6703_00270 [Zetaproteobacteria bacterium]
MNDTTNAKQNAPSETTEQTTTQEDKSCKGCSSACGQLPLIVGLVALALAAYASFAPRQNSELNNQLQQLNSEVASLKQRLDTLNMDTESSRDAHVRMQLKRVLLDIEGAKSMASPDMEPALQKAADQIRQLVEPEVQDKPTAHADREMPAETTTETKAPAEDEQTEETENQQDIPTIEVPAFPEQQTAEEPVAPEAAQ